MAKVTYTPKEDYGDEGKTRQGRYSFEKGKSVEVTDERALAKFRGNSNFTVAGAKEAKAPKDDGTDEPVDPLKNAPSIANQVYPTQPPGVGSKTSAVPRPEGSLEAAIEAAGGDMKLAAQRAEETARATRASADTLAKAQQASDKGKPKPARKSASKKASKAKSSKRK